MKGNFKFSSKIGDVGTGRTNDDVLLLSKFRIHPDLSILIAFCLFYTAAHIFVEDGDYI